MTKAEAEKQVEELNNNAPNWFCPLIKEMCRKDCVNYYHAIFWPTTPCHKGKLVDIKKDDFNVQGPFCSNAMFMETDLVCPHGQG